MTEPATDESQYKIEQNQILLKAEIKEWWVTRVMRPVEHFCIKHQVSPNFITYTGLFFCFLCGILYANGKFLTAGWMVLLAGSLDFLDGRVARATNRVTAQGSFLDTVADRYQDFFLLAGLAVYFRDSPILLVALLAVGGASFVPYVKAAAEIRGIDLSRVGAMQRPERIFTLGFGSIVSSIFQISLMPFYGKGNPPPQHLLITVILLLAVASNLTAIRRIQYTMKALEEKK